MRAENTVSPVMIADGHGFRSPSSGRSNSEVVHAWSLLELKSIRISSANKSRCSVHVKSTLYSKNLTLSVTVKIHLNISDGKDIFAA